MGVLDVVEAGEVAMADADWVKYRQIRGKALPERASLLGTTYVLQKVLKQDFYAAVGLYERENPGDSVERSPAQVLLKTYHTESFWGVPLGWMGRLLCRREVDYIRRLNDVDGIPHYLETYGEAGFVRQFIPGCNLREYSKSSQVDAEFFPRLRQILTKVHARGISHNDLSKPENVLVTTDGKPVLIDFQIATRILSDRDPVRSRMTRWFVHYMQRVDHYHLTKLHTRRRPDDFTAEEHQAALRKGVVLTMHGWVRRPYRAVRHRFLKRLLKDEAKAALSDQREPARV